MSRVSSLAQLGKRPAAFYFVERGNIAYDGSHEQLRRGSKNNRPRNGFPTYFRSDRFPSSV